MDRIKELVEWLFKCRANLPHWLSKSLILAVVLISASCNRTPETVSSPPSPTDTPPSSPTDAPPPSPSPSPEAIDDLEDGNAVNKLGGYWYTYNDNDKGGDSKVLTPSGEFSPSAGGANKSKKSARMTGKVTKTYQYGFIGMGTNLGEGDNTAVDVSKYKGIEFCAKGDGQEYRVKLRSLAIKDSNDYGYNFTAPLQWQCYQVKFDKMAQEDWGKEKTVSVPQNEALAQTTAIQWQTVGQPHESVELALDDIKFLQ